MRRILYVATVLAAAVTAALAIGVPITGAAHQATSQSLRIDVTGQEHGTGTFTMIGPTSAYTDSGAITRKDAYGAVKKTPNGHSYALNGGTSTFMGKHGRIVVRTAGKSYFMDEHEVWIGTWKVIRGTGKYAELKGTGGFTAVHPGDFTYAMRFEGLINRT